ncbi:glycosyltransferase family 2 protein [Micromonospora craniellae]|uniref:Glycosyltransferase family 2 protein n=1 Tax=Micromonospora craniellae TaxID=2294034 RepID=A0A372G6A4_9ACTN|nr:glycosyltransferase family 2 protein [Micromonospora craniellae]RFS48555.1 glycosyltransferase family 2 protein [Micromonospora craniellae]
MVIPARNEARNLEEVLPRLPDVHEIVVVDGASVDDTIETVRRVKPSARIVGQTRRGKGNALACGFAEATGDIIVMFDADGSADPEEIQRFVHTLTEGADFAKGSRVMPGGGSQDLTIIRGLGNRSLTWFTNRLFRTRYSDLCYGYNAFWRDVLPSLVLPDPKPEGQVMRWGDGFEIETVLNCRVAVAGLRVREVPSVELSRIHGTSNLSAVRDGLRVLKTILTERQSARRHRAIARAVMAAPKVIISELVPAQRRADLVHAGLVADERAA